MLRGSNSLSYFRVCYTLLTRVHAWLHSVAKLGSPADLQAFSAASRSVFETAVDMVLIQHQEKQSVAKLLAWERSSKLRYAERRSAHGDEPDALEFIKRHRKAVLDLRTETWGLDRRGKPISPDRWTGRHLGDDAKLAEGFCNAGFTKFYALRYTQACWYVHGSGVLGFLEVPDQMFPELCALALHDLCVFGQICAEYSLRLVNAFDEISEERFRQLKQQLGVRGLVAIGGLQH